MSCVCRWCTCKALRLLRIIFLCIFNASCSREINRTLRKLRQSKFRKKQNPRSQERTKRRTQLLKLLLTRFKLAMAAKRLNRSQRMKARKTFQPELIQALQMNRHQNPLLLRRSQSLRSSEKRKLLQQPLLSNKRNSNLKKPKNLKQRKRLWLTWHQSVWPQLPLKPKPSQRTRKRNRRAHPPKQRPKKTLIRFNLINDWLFFSL